MNIIPSGISFQGKLQLFPSSQIKQLKQSDEILTNSLSQMDSFVKNKLPEDVIVYADVDVPTESDEEGEEDKGISIEFKTSSNKVDSWNISRDDFVENKNNMVDYIKYQFAKYAMNPKLEPTVCENLDFYS